MEKYLSQKYSHSHIKPLIPKVSYVYRVSTLEYSCLFVCLFFKKTSFKRMYWQPGSKIPCKDAYFSTFFSNG